MLNNGSFMERTIEIEIIWKVGCRKTKETEKFGDMGACFELDAEIDSITHMEHKQKINLANLTLMPTLPVLKMNRLTMGLQLSMEKENESSHKQENKRVSKAKFLLARRNGRRLFAWRLRSLVIRVRRESDEEEVDQSYKAARRSTLDCPALLEESLPMKRGLSSYYIGKSKSFGNLTDLAAGDSIELGKKEHRLNKRRRLLLAHELYDDKKTDEQNSGMSSSMSVSSSMPILSSDGDPMDQTEQDMNKEGKFVNGDKKQPEKEDQK